MSFNPLPTELSRWRFLLPELPDEARAPLRYLMGVAILKANN
jgi:hypothetical protein